MIFRALRVLGAVALVAIAVCAGTVTPASADSYVPIAGAGSTWSQNAIDQFRRDVQQYGMRIDYAGTGSSDGRRQFLNGTVDFAASDIPFQANPEDNSAPELPTPGSYAYMPITAGGTVFTYNLHIGATRVTNLRLSGANIAKIFTGQITKWNDPAIQADNPGLVMPAKSIVPVVRSDGSGSTAQFTLWMISQYPSIWNAYCQASRRAPKCGETSIYPTISSMVAQNGDLGVMGYVAQGYADGAIGYVNFSYALNAGFPVAKMLNAAGYYTEPTPDNVAVSLLNAQINNDPKSPDYLTQQLGSVYTDNDPRSYPLSSYSYLILPTTVQGQFTADKGKTLAAFSYYAMCQGQQQSASLGYSPMPINLVQASFTQITKIPGAVVQNINIQSCNNPTFSSTGVNELAANAPQPLACDKQGPTQNPAGTGGAKAPTAVLAAASCAASSTSQASSSSTHGAAGSSTRSGSGAATGSTGSGSTTGAGDTTTTVANAESGLQNQACADSGNCQVADASPAGLTAAASASPLTLPGGGGWTSAQTLMVLAIVLAIGLIAGPGFVSAYLRKRSN